jgi:diguanylate cyclase (GGDEF)-like protein
MNDRPSSSRSKIAQLRAKFVEQLPGRLSEARRHFEAIRAHPNDHEAAVTLHRFLHSIKGTGKSFGFNDLGAVAGQGEHLAGQLLEIPVNVTLEFWLDLDECLSNMGLCITVLQDAGFAPSQGGQTPFFELPPDSLSTQEESNDRLVYVCDDEPMQAEYLGEQLRCFGYQAVLFNNTEDFRQAVLKEQPAVVIMDLMFPEGDSAGANVLIDLRVNHGTLFPAVFISARRDFGARLSAIRAGGEAYFPKPVRAMDLVVTLDSLTRQSVPEPFRVLVVDDEPEIAQYHSLILEDAGIVTQVAHEPESVLNVVGEFRPDLVLMDMYMPKCSGREAAKLIRQIPDFVSLPIVFLSSETDTKKQFSAMAVGAEGFLTKPILPKDLVTEVALRAERMRTLRSLMARDTMTGLFNHTTINQLLDNAIIATRRQNSPLSFAMIDVDRFKSVNDTYGHPVGDQVLLALARVLQQRLRNSDLVGRYGGEEFAVILNGVELGKAEQIMEQLREDFSKVVFNAGDVKFSCTFSCGVASFPQLDDMETLREAADKAMYQAKHAGRNRVVAYAK